MEESLKTTSLTPEDFRKMKYPFVVAFLAAVLALIALKDTLSPHTIDLLFVTSNAYQAMAPFALLLGLSTYLYALSLISLNLYRRLGAKLNGAADFFYAMGLLYPLALLLLLGVSYLVRQGDLPKPEQILIGAILGVSTGLVSTWISARYSYRKAQAESFALVLRTVRSFIERAEDGLRRRSYGYALVAANGAVRIILCEMMSLIEDGYLRKKTPIESITRQAVVMKIISEEQAKIIVDASRAEVNKAYSKKIADQIVPIAGDLLQVFELEKAREGSNKSTR